MNEDKKTFDVEELFIDQTPKQNEEAPSHDAPKLKLPRSTKKHRDSDDEDEKEKEKEENEKKGLIRKIKEAFRDDLLGQHEEIAKYKKMKLVNMTLKELRQTWSDLTYLACNEHPRHMVYKSLMMATRKVEDVISKYPGWKAPGLAKRMEEDKELRTMIHMTALDILPHQSTGGLFGTAYRVWANFETSRSQAKEEEARQELWMEQIVPDDIINKFENL